MREIKVFCEPVLMQMEQPYALCTSEELFKEFMTKLEINTDAWPAWVSPTGSATTHSFTHPTHGPMQVVCIRTQPHMTPIEIACLLVHEAVHVWQQYCEDIGETAPGAEQEAYSIQRISQELMEAYVSQQGVNQ